MSFLPNPESIRDWIGNLSEEKGLRTSRNDRNHQKDVVIFMVLLVTVWVNYWRIR